MCRNLRRVLQVDINNDSAGLIKTDRNKSPFALYPKFDDIDRGKKFYRVSLDVNFRNIDAMENRPVSIRNQSFFKPFSISEKVSLSKTKSNKRKGLETVDRSMTSLTTKKDRKENAISKPAEPQRHSTLTPNYNRHVKNTTMNFSSKPPTTDRLFMTHRKIYKPCLEEIVEENKSENSGYKSTGKIPSIQTYGNTVFTEFKNQYQTQKQPELIGTTDLKLEKRDQSSEDTELNYQIDVVKAIVTKITQNLGIDVTFDTLNDRLSRARSNGSIEAQSPGGSALRPQTNGLIKKSNSKVRIIFDKRGRFNPQVRSKLSDKFRKHRTAFSVTQDDPKEDLQNQAGTTGYNQNFDEKSLKLKITESNRSQENNKDEESSDSDVETDGMISFSNDSQIESNVGSIREFSINTKMNRDTLQESSARKERLKTSPDIRGGKTKNKRSRQTLVPYDYSSSRADGFASKESICLEGVPTKVNSIPNLNFISARNQRYDNNFTGT